MTLLFVVDDTSSPDDYDDYRYEYVIHDTVYPETPIHYSSPVSAIVVDENIFVDLAAVDDFESDNDYDHDDDPGDDEDYDPIADTL
jgi:hypothetical protein